MNPETLFHSIARPSVVERIELAARPEILSDIPAPYDTGDTATWIKTMLGGRERIWQHQAKTLALVAEGRNVVISTGTASGKTLCFQVPIIHDMLETDGCCIVLYPQKALGGDQLARWETALEMAGLPTSLVGEINGDVAMSARDAVINDARIVLATPDVVHAWLMRHLASNAVRRFLSRLRFLVIDETHVFEGAFGSNSAFLFRRLRAARARVCPTAFLKHLQIIAATATIADAAQHLEQLTGCSFVEVGEEDNGAPVQPRTLLHVDGQATGESAERALSATLKSLADAIGDDAFIAFADSRQGVERIARLVGRDDVLPYRSGYEGVDRRAIERALRKGQLRGGISTSALELGIDIPQFTTGINLGIPISRKALRQRIGRVGRSKPGVFVVIAPAPSFLQLGTSLREFYEGSVEPSHLYCGNEIIQFAQARCLLEEIDGGHGDGALPADADWPEGFAASFEMAKPGAPRSASLDQVAALGGDRPHINYPIRNICETNFALRMARGDQSLIGTIPFSKALREAYPGATYFHLRRAHRVVEWRSTSYDRTIRLEPIASAEITRPLLTTQVNVATGQSEVIEGRLLRSASGSLAEIQLRVIDSVEGYRSGAATLLYRDLKDRDPRMRRQSREIGTTGVLLRIDEPWFAGKGKHQIEARKAVARALVQLTATEHSIAPSEIASTHIGIALHEPAGVRRIEDAIVIFDNVAGGLRLTAPLFDEMQNVIARLRKAAAAAGSNALLGVHAADSLHAWFDRLKPADAALMPAMAAGDDERIIYAPSSEVGVRHAGLLHTRRLIEPRMISTGGAEALMYLYESAPGVRALVPHDQIEPTGDNWRRIFWNPSANTFREHRA